MDIKCECKDTITCLDRLYVYECESSNKLTPIQIQKTNWAQAKKTPSFFVCFSFSSNITYYTDFPEKARFGAVPMCAEKCVNQIVNTICDQVFPLFSADEKINYRIKGCYTAAFEYNFSDIEKLDVNNYAELINISVSRYFGFYRCMSSLAVYLWVK